MANVGKQTVHFSEWEKINTEFSGGVGKNHQWKPVTIRSRTAKVLQKHCQIGLQGCHFNGYESLIELILDNNLHNIHFIENPTDYKVINFYFRALWNRQNSSSL